MVKAGSAGRFGVRYGNLVKNRISAIEAKQKKRQLCIFCGGKAKRSSKGIWNCLKCGKVFAGHAYYLEQPQASENREKPQEEKSEKALKKQKS